MTRKENARAAVLATAQCTGRTNKQIAAALGLSVRQVQRLKRALREEGPAGLAHGNRGRGPANKVDVDTRQRVLTLSAEHHWGFNDTHFTEMLASREGIELSRETVRSLRREAGIKPKQKRRATRHHNRRPRKLAEGMMMLWDGSPHRWFGQEGEPCCLMAAMDDATGKALALRFVPFESSHGYLRLLWEVVNQYGIPASVYQDMHGALKRNDDRWTIEEELAGRQEPTQVGAALEALGIQSIFALSPQAKGRVERLFKALQDRLYAMMQLEGVADVDSANSYITSYFLDYFNSRFSAAAQDAAGAWRKVKKGLDLERIISLRYEAAVGNDNAIRLGGIVVDVPPGPAGRGYAAVRAEVRQMLDGSWRVYYRDKLLEMSGLQASRRQ